MLVGGLGYNHVHDANHARVLKVVDASGGNPERATIYLGGVYSGASLRRCAPDREPLYRDRPPPSRGQAGTWTKYVHDDAKRVGNAGAAQKFFHHRDR